MEINFMQFIQDNFMLIAIVLYILGVWIKAVKKIPDEFIPFILLAIGEVFALWIGGFNAGSVMQGVLVTGLSVLANQGLKQAVKLLDKEA